MTGIANKILNKNLSANFCLIVIKVIGCISWLIVVEATFCYAENSRQLQGTVADSTGNPLSLVNVYLYSRPSVGTTTGRQGRFKFAIFSEKDSVRLVFDHIGYQSEILTCPVNNLSRQINVHLTPVAIYSGTVVVSGHRGNPGIALSHRQLTHRSLQNIPAVGEGDLIRALSILPGAAQPNDYRSSLSIRGGRQDQNLLMIDGIVLLEQHHFLGIFNAVNTYMSQSVDYNPGYHPVHYEGRLGGVIDVHTPDPMNWRSKKRLSLSFLSASGLYQHRWDSFGLSLALRKTFLDFLYPRYGFYDANIKGLWSWSSSTYFTLSGYLGQDQYRVPVDAGSSQEKYVPYWKTKPYQTWGNKFIHLRLRHSFTQHNFGVQIDGTRKWADTTFPPYATNKISAWVGQIRFLWKKRSFKGEFGWKDNARHYRYRWSTITADNRVQDLGIPVLPYPGETHYDIQQFRNILYEAITYRFTRSTMTAGLRTFFYKGAVYTTPQAQIAVQCLPSWKSQLAYIQTRQFDYRLENRTEFQLESPLIPLDSPIHAENYSWNNFLRFSKEYNGRLEMYYRELHDVPDYYSMHSGEETHDFRIFGTDFSVIDHKGRLTWQLGTSLLRILEKSRHVWHLADWDIPVSIKGSVGFEVKHRWFINLAGRYRSGLPYDQQLAFFRDSDGRIRRIARVNANRLSPYIRWDVALRKQFKASAGYKYTIVLQVINVTNRKNLIRIPEGDYDTPTNMNTQLVGKKGLPLLPSLGVNFEF